VKINEEFVNKRRTLRKIAVDSDFAAQVHHPDGVLDKVVVQDGASVKDGIRVPVNGQTGASVLPVLPQMVLVVEPRLWWRLEVENTFETRSGG
jgi:hypothetical protein